METIRIRDGPSSSSDDEGVRPRSSSAQYITQTTCSPKTQRLIMVGLSLGGSVCLLHGYSLGDPLLLILGLYMLSTGVYCLITQGII